MPVEVSWYVPSRVIYLRVYGVVSFEDLATMPNMREQFLLNGKPPLHTILDDNDGLPPITSLKQFHEALGIQSSDVKYMGWIVAVGNPHQMAKVLISLFMRILGINYTRVNTLQEAIDFLQEHEPELEFPAERPIPTQATH